MILKLIHTDAGCKWQETKNKPTVKGRICIADHDGFVLVEEPVLETQPHLRQYINVFEMLAIARAIEIATEKKWGNALSISTDSMTARFWVTNGIKNKKVSTPLHQAVYQRVCEARRAFGGVITFHLIPREENRAGHVLEDMLEKEKYGA